MLDPQFGICVLTNSVMNLLGKTHEDGWFLFFIYSSYSCSPDMLVAWKVEKNCLNSVLLLEINCVLPCARGNFMEVKCV